MCDYGGSAIAFQAQPPLTISPPHLGHLRDKNVPKGIVDGLLGWASSEHRMQMTDHYDQRRIPMGKLVEGIEALEYPWFSKLLSEGR
ncbi:MAG: hypothetical protein H7841_18055 [Magnetospirillum sp. WYHS-4]